MSNEIAVSEQLQPMSVAQMKQQVQTIQQVMREVMIDGTHYGTIPGCGDKKALLKPGAEKLCMTFRFDPQYDVTQERDGDHLTVTSKCTLFHIGTGMRIGSGMGSCSTRESKYAYRTATRRCPHCNAEAIIKGKDEYGGGWLCYGKKGGCGAKFPDGDQSIESQSTGRADNEDKADQYNTVLKMANKRSLVAATITATAASDIFVQDLDDGLIDPDAEDERPSRKDAQRKPVAQPQSKSKPVTVNAEEVIGDGPKKIVRAKLEQGALTETQLCEKFGVASIDAITKGKINEVLAWLANPNA